MVRIGTSALNPAGRLGWLWSAVLALLPGYRVQYVPLESTDYGFPDQYRHLGENVDILYGPSGFVTTADLVDFEQIGVYRFTLALHRGDPLAGTEEIPPSDLSGRTVWMMDDRPAPGTIPVIDRVRDELRAQALGIRLRPTDPHYTIETFNRFAATENGDCLLSLECWDHALPGLLAWPLAVTETMPYGLLFPRHPNARLGAFISTVRKVVAAHR